MHSIERELLIENIIIIIKMKEEKKAQRETAIRCAHYTGLAKVLRAPLYTVN